MNKDALDETGITPGTPPAASLAAQPLVVTLERRNSEEAVTHWSRVASMDSAETLLGQEDLRVPRAAAGCADAGCDRVSKPRRTREATYPFHSPPPEVPPDGPKSDGRIAPLAADHGWRATRNPWLRFAVSAQIADRTDARRK